MTWKKLTHTAKKKITNDWNNCFPSLGIYKPMHLMNRIGPLLVGILLDVKTGGSDYIPTYHVHNLIRPFPVISLGLKTTLNYEYVNIEWHESKFYNLSELMMKYALIPFDGELDLTTVLAGYKKHLAKPHIPYQPQEYEDMVLISAWCNNTLQVKNSLDFARDKMGRWPPQVLKRIGGLDIWSNSVKEKAITSETLKSIVDKQIKELKVGRLPVRNLLC
jgi:hypothetical protein